ncbi:MAG TPA: arsinothricin resistance N-acetyltransferase ArsN1 family B [Euzebyales bacterium]
MSTPRLRLATADDAAPIAEIYAPLVRDTAITFETQPPSADEMRRRIVGTTMRFPWLVADDAGTVTGFAYAGRHRRRAAYAWAADVSVYVAADTRRGGIGRGLYTTLLDLLTAQGYANAFAGIALPNDASVRLHETLGFMLVGVYESVGYKLDDWWDVAWWQRRLPIGASPPPPTAVVELDTRRVDAALAAGGAYVRG